MPIGIDQTSWTFNASPSETFSNGETISVRVSGTLGLDGTATGQLDVETTNRPSDQGPFDCTSGTFAFSVTVG